MPEPVYVWGQAEPATWLPELEAIAQAQDAARLVRLGPVMLRWPPELEAPRG